MKIYLAGNFSLMLTKNRERKTCSKFSTWKRLFSYYYKKCIYESEILKIKKENENENKQK